MRKLTTAIAVARQGPAVSVTWSQKPRAQRSPFLGPHGDSSEFSRQDFFTRRLPRYSDRPRAGDTRVMLSDALFDGELPAGEGLVPRLVTEYPGIKQFLFETAPGLRLRCGPAAAACVDLVRLSACGNGHGLVEGSPPESRLERRVPLVEQPEPVWEGRFLAGDRGIVRRDDRLLMYCTDLFIRGDGGT